MPQIKLSNASSHPQISAKHPTKLDKDFLELHPFQPTMPDMPPGLHLSSDEIKEKIQNGAGYNVLDWQWHRNALQLARQNETEHRKDLRAATETSMQNQHVERLLKSIDQRYLQEYREFNQAMVERYTMFSQVGAKTTDRIADNLQAVEKTQNLRQATQKVLEFISLLSPSSKYYAYALNEKTDPLQAQRVLTALLKSSQEARQKFSSLDLGDREALLGKDPKQDPLIAISRK